MQKRKNGIKKREYTEFKFYKFNYQYFKLKNKNKCVFFTHFSLSF